MARWRHRKAEEHGPRQFLIYIDFDALERIPNLSADWFREAARQNRVV